MRPGSIDCDRAPSNTDARITIETADAARLVDIDAAWAELAGRADTANVFMNPALVRQAARAYAGRRFLALLAWEHNGGDQRLVGLWAFSVGRPRRCLAPVTALNAPVFEHAYLATPVIDRARLDATFDAMLDHIAASAELPKLVALESMGMDGATMQALTRVLTARENPPHIFAATRRPMLVSDLDGKTYLERSLSASSRKKLRQHRRRLGEKGALASRVVTDAEAVCRAFEDFLTLEASGWKGGEGTALQCRDADAAFARSMIAVLAARGEAAMHVLELDGRPVSMQIVLRAGPAAYTWKTAYDEAFGNFSPGALLLEDYTAAFLADRTIVSVDSCAFDDTSYMATWRERQTIADLWFDVRRGRPAAFTITTQWQRAYLALRRAAKSLYHSYLERRMTKG